MASIQLLAIVTACSGGADDRGATPEQPPLEIGPGEVALPPDSVDGLALETLGRVDARLDDGGFRNPTIVAEVDGAIVAVSTIDEAAAAAQGFPDLEQWGELGPGVDGAQAYITTRGLPMPVPMPSIVYRAEPGTLVEVASRELDPMELAAVAVDISLPIDADDAVPGEVIGSYTGTYHLLLPGATHAHYQDEDGGMSLTVAAATPAQQAAILAVTYDDPETQIDEQTEASCCSDQVFRAPRQHRIRGAIATIATLTPHIVVLVLEGDSGLVITTTPPQPGGGIPVDDRLVAVAQNVQAGSAAELDALIEELDARALDRQIARIEARERGLGWEVLASHKGVGQAAVVSVGRGERPDVELTGPALCAVAEGGNPPSCLTARSDGVVTPGGDGVDVIFGAVADEVASVDLEFPGGTHSASIYQVDAPARLPDRVYLAAISIDELGRLTDNFNAAQEARIVARDRAGEVIGQAPMFAHLRGS